MQKTNKFEISTTEAQRSRATTKTILYQRGHEGTRREPKPKLTAEVAKEAQRAQRRKIKTKSANQEPKIGHELRELTRIKPERGQKHYHSVTEPQPKTKIHH